MKIIYVSIMSLMVLAMSSCIDFFGCHHVRSDNSTRAQLDVVVEGQEMTVTLTNLTDKVVAVDKEMELYFTIIFVGVDYGIGEVKGFGKPLSERIVLLKPNESVSKKFRTGDIRHRYSVSLPVGGWNATPDYSMAGGRVPDFSKVDGIVVKYSSRSWDSMMPGFLAYEQGYNLPDDLMLDAKVSVVVKLKRGFKYDMRELRGDKSWRVSKISRLPSLAE